MTQEPSEVIDWDDMSKDDQKNAQNLLIELNKIFDKYSIKEEEKDLEE
jgi:hypothetical protein